MLRITIPARPPMELWDNVNEVFIDMPGSKEQQLQLEHSLVSISKWESRWCKPFLSKQAMTDEETIDYIRCMTLTQNVPPEVYNNITDEIIEKVKEYIEAPMTATWFSKDGRRGANNETVTSELIYYWMISLNIPMKCEKWHLNRLLTLVKVCNRKNQPAKKMSKQSILSRYAELNKARREKFNSKG